VHHQVWLANALDNKPPPLPYTHPRFFLSPERPEYDFVVPVSSSQVLFPPTSMNPPELCSLILSAGLSEVVVGSVLLLEHSCLPLISTSQFCPQAEGFQSTFISSRTFTHSCPIGGNKVILGKPGFIE
jgi:hypothetical protein